MADIAKKKWKELLEHYAEKTPNQFYQIDVFDVGPDYDDPVMQPDEEGDCMLGGRVWELMTSCPEVRVLMPVENCDPATVVRQLKKVIAHIEHDPAWITPQGWEAEYLLFGVELADSNEAE